ncbi:MAG: PAS domain-containing protein [Pelosinus sp.]|nr:PAS domain-containing protein [Pelosinus sp.]
MEQFNPIQIIFDNMPYLAWMKDSEGRYIVVNRAFKEFSHKKNDEIIGKFVSEVFSGRIAAEYQQVDDAVLEWKKTQFLDHIYLEGVAGTKWFDTVVSPYWDAKGEFIGTIGFSRRISKRKNLEMELEHQKIFLSTMIDTIPDIIVYKDNSSRTLGCNKACLERFYGAAEELEVIGKTTLEILGDDRLATSCLKKDGEVFQFDETRKYEEKYGLIDGTIIDVETVKTPYHNKNGKVAGLIAVSRDITARKELEKELLRREQETNAELELAARVQRDTLPEPFAGSKVRVNTLFFPYHTVSGDLFNYKYIKNEQKLCGYLVDVSGHGVATALQTATIKMLLDTSLLTGRKIDEDDFTYINQKMQQYLYEESFAGVMYFEFNFQTAILKVISGGINLFLVATQDKCSLIPVYSGFLGVFDEADVEVLTMSFKAGEIYSMMTDGVSDLIETHGVKRQKGLAGYTAWLEGFSKSSERSDDCSAIVIEIVEAKGKLKVSCSMNDQEISEVQRAISDFLGEVAPDCAVMLEVAVNEAINNSLAASGQAFITIKRIGRKLIARVMDDGPGFDTARTRGEFKSAVCEAIIDETQLSERGRGILLMQAFCDHVIYNRKGNQVLLIKNIRQQ